MKAGVREPRCGIRQGAPAGRCGSGVPATRSRQRGFTLLEVIAAILLLGIAFAALLKVAGGAMALSRDAADRDEAALWARSLLDSAFVATPVAPGRRSGRFDARYQWTLTTTPWQAPGSPPGSDPLALYRLDLAVRWGNGARPQVAHFETLRLGAAPAATPP